MNRRSLPAPLLALALLAAVAAPAAAAPPAPAPAAAATIPIDEVHVGQKGYGLSVFTGGQVERFEVEVLGVLRNLTPDTSYILARLTGHGLEKHGVIAGMSGSPVFLDGRLAGAVAFGWPFSNDAVGGITPIADMRRLNSLAAPGAAPAASPPLPPVALADLLGAKLPAGLLERELARLRPPVAAGGVSSVQWSAAGFGELSQGLLRQALGPVFSAGAAPGGTGTALPGAAPATLAPGAAVGAVLIDGDLKFAATGTVTDVEGDQVIAFGHPLLGLGPISLPMASSEIVTVISNQYSSFKIANLGVPIGAFEQDRSAGIQGRLGATAPMIPLTLRVGGAEKSRTFHMRLAEVPQFTPLLLATSALGGLEAATYIGGAHGLDLTARFRLSGGRQLALRQSFAGDGAALQSATFLLAVAAYLLQNPLERVAVEEIEVDLGQQDEPRSAQLVGAHAERTVVRPGERVALNVDLVPYRGAPFRRTFQLDLPQDLPAGRYSLLVGDGTSVDAARFAIEPVEPVTFTQALDLLGSLHSRRDIVALGVFGGQGLAIAGEVLPRLPASVRSLWAGTPTGGAVPLKLAVAQQHLEPVDLPVEGLVRVDLEVRRREPQAAAEAQPVAAGAVGEEAAPGEKPAAAPPPDGKAGKTGKAKPGGKGR